MIYGKKLPNSKVLHAQQPPPSNGDKGFIVTGKSSNYRFDDIWELHPYEYDDDNYENN